MTPLWCLHLNTLCHRASWHIASGQTHLRNGLYTICLFYTSHLICIILAWIILPELKQSNAKCKMWYLKYLPPSKSAGDRNSCHRDSSSEWQMTVSFRGSVHICTQHKLLHCFAQISSRISSSIHNSLFYQNESNRRMKSKEKTSKYDLNITIQLKWKLTWTNERKAIQDHIGLR